MAGVYFPLHPMEHQYIVTDDIAQIYDADSEHPHVMDPAGESYLRQEGRGLCIGFYEQTCKPWAVDGTSWEFGHELLPDDLDKIEDSITFAYKRFPVLETAGVKSVIHGPFTFAPDGNPLVGPVPGLRNYWSACGVMAGFSQGGAITLARGLTREQPLAGLVVLSSYVPIHEHLLPKTAAAAPSMPLFMAHGSLDPVVPEALGKLSKDLLEGVGMKPQWHSCQTQSPY